MCDFKREYFDTCKKKSKYYSLYDISQIFTYITGWRYFIHMYIYTNKMILQVEFWPSLVTFFLQIGWCWWTWDLFLKSRIIAVLRWPANLQTIPFQMSVTGHSHWLLSPLGKENEVDQKGVNFCVWTRSCCHKRRVTGGRGSEWKVYLNRVSDVVVCGKEETRIGHLSGMTVSLLPLPYTTPQVLAYEQLPVIAEWTVSCCCMIS